MYWSCMHRLVCISLDNEEIDSIVDIKAYHSLDQLHSLVSDVVDDSRNIHHSLLPNLLQNMVYCDECPCPTHSSTGNIERERVCVYACGYSDLQCTMMGPFPAGCSLSTLLWKARMGVA